MTARIIALGLFAAVASAQPRQQPAAAQDAAGKSGRVADGPTLRDWLLQYGRAIDTESIDRLVQQLGSASFEDRERARKDLIAFGPPALPRLRLHLKKHPEIEIERRLEAMIAVLAEAADRMPPDAVVDGLLRHRPPGSLEALLAFLPFAETEPLVETIWFGAEQLAATGAKTTPALSKLLRDKEPSRRALAGFLLAVHGSADERKTAFELLDDADPEVRLRTAQGLLAVGDVRGVAVLVGLLEHPRLDLAWQAEELLTWLAGDNGPDLLLGAGEPEARQAARKAWENWRHEGAAKMNSKELFAGPSRPGLVLASSAFQHKDPTNPAKIERTEQRVWLFGCDGRPRWFTPVGFAALDMQWIEGNRLLICAGPRPGAILEFDATGKILRQVDLDQRQSYLARRRADGKTLVVASDGLFIVSAAGQVQRLAAGRISAAQVLPGGNVVCLEQRSRLTEYNAEGRLLRAEVLPTMRDYDLGRMWPVDNGLVAHERRPGSARWSTKIITAKGEPVRDLDFAIPWDVAPLRNDRLLIAAGWWMDHRVAEVNAAGRTVWEGCLPGPPGAKVRPCFNLVRLGFPERPAWAHLDSAAARAGQLTSKSPWIRRRAVYALRGMNGLGPETIPALIRMLSDTDETCRDMAAHTLQKVGPEAIPHAVALLKHADPKLRVRGLSILYTQGTLAWIALPELIHAWNDLAKEVRNAGASVLFVLGPDAAPAAPALVRSLTSADQETRKRAIELLGSVQSLAPASRRELIRLLDDPDTSVRQHAAAALVRIGADDQHLLNEFIFPALAKLLNDQDAWIRHAACWTVTELGMKAKPLVPALAASLESPGAGRYQESALAGAISALARIGPDAKAAAPILFRMARGDMVAHSIRCTAAQHLGDLGLDPEEALPVLREVLADAHDSAARASACRSLGKMGAAAVPLLRERLNTADHRAAIDALAAMGPPARAAVPDLLAVLKDETRPWVHPVADALVSIAPDSAEVRDAVLQRFRDKRWSAGLVEAVTKLARHDRKLATTLLNMVSSPESPRAIRARIGAGLAREGIVHKELVPHLISLLEPDEHGDSIDLPSLIRWIKIGRFDATTLGRDSCVAAATALGFYGPQAAPALPALATMAQDDSPKHTPQQRWIACWALGKLATHHAAVRRTLVEILRNPLLAPELRTEAVAGLSSAGQAVPELLAILECEDQSWSAKLLAIETLSALGSNARRAASALAKIEDGDDPLLQRAARRALAMIQAR
jgi:HEAT repeat protein